MLSVQTDPDNRLDTLIISLDTHQDPTQAMIALDQLDSEWWFAVPFNIRDLVLITLGVEE